jgi:excisionase family DNA binding protein
MSKRRKPKPAKCEKHPKSPGEWLTMQAVAAELAISDEVVRSLCISGKLRSVAVSGTHRKHRRIKREWLDSYLAEQERAEIQERAHSSPAQRSAQRPARSSNRHLLGV